MRAVGYVRVSTDDQVDNHSLGAQRREITRYCERQGYELTGFYADEGVSAYTEEISKRPQLAALLHAASSGSFDVVIVHTLDRWARNIGVQRQALQRLGDSQVGFASVTENIDFTTPVGRLTLTMMGGVSEFFSDQLGVHVAKGQRERAETGLPVGPVPFGYRVGESDEVASLVEKEAAAVRQVFERRAAGESTGELASWLNTQGFRTRTGQNFTSFAVRDMLKCRFYVGVVVHRDDEFPGRHEALISEELFERVAVRRMRRQPATRRSRGGMSGILRGRVACGNCGNSIHSERSHYGYPMYRERHGRECATNGRSVIAHRIDEQIEEIFRALELPRSWRQRMSKLSAQPNEGVDTQALKESRRRLGRVYADGALSDGEYEARLAAIDSKLKAAEIVAQPSIEDAAELFGNLPQLWTEATPDERGQLIAPLLDRVYVDIETRRVGAITPAPAFRTLIDGALERTDRSACVVLATNEADRLDDWSVWWRRGRVELPVQRGSRGGIYERVR
jgi:DNA invertase Pin-like site-specific DNA recombinase